MHLTLILSFAQSTPKKGAIRITQLSTTNTEVNLDLPSISSLETMGISDANMFVLFLFMYQVLEHVMCMVIYRMPHQLVLRVP